MLFDLLAMVVDIIITDADIAIRGGHVACHDLHGSGFACPIGTQKTQYFARIHLKRDIVYGFLVAIGFAEALYGYIHRRGILVKNSTKISAKEMYVNCFSAFRAFLAAIPHLKNSVL